jgi:hypothetical protein
LQDFEKAQETYFFALARFMAARAFDVFDIPASLRAMATACFWFVTFWPELELSVPAFHSFITFPIFSFPMPTLLK